MKGNILPNVSLLANFDFQTRWPLECKCLLSTLRQLIARKCENSHFREKDENIGFRANALNALGCLRSSRIHPLVFGSIQMLARGAAAKRSGLSKNKSKSSGSEEAERGRRDKRIKARTCE